MDDRRARVTFVEDESTDSEEEEVQNPSPLPSGRMQRPHSLAALQSMARMKGATGARDQWGETTDRITLDIHQLTRLKGLFDNDKRSRLLNEDQFVRHFQPILGQRMTEAQLKVRFTQIDADADGTINWDEFSTYLLLEDDTMGLSQDKTYVSQIAERIETAKHRSMISNILLHPKIPGMYFTTGEDGCVHIWNSELGHEGSLYFPGSACITGGCFLQSGNALVTCSVDRVVNVWNLTDRSLLRRYVGHQKFGRHQDRQEITFKKRGKAGTIAGDNHCKTEGKTVVETVTLLELLEPIKCVECIKIDDKDHLLFGMHSGGAQLYNITKQHTQDFSVAGVPPWCKPTCKWPTLHKESVVKVQYCDPMGGFISASWDRRIHFTSLDALQPFRTIGERTGESDGHTKSIFTFAWNDHTRMLATCGADRDVFLWNPWIDRPLFKFPAGMCTQVGLAFNSQDMQLIGLGADKTIRIWDMRSYKLFQSLHENHPLYPEDHFSAIAYDERLRRIIVGSSVPRMYTMSRALTSFGVNYRGHTEPTIGALFNHKFHQVITLDVHTVNVWRVETGDKGFSFPVTDHALSALTFDASQRRLVVGTTGRCLVYNYMNGNLLREYNVPCSGELSCLAYVCRGVNEDTRFIWATVGESIVIFDDSRSADPSWCKVLNNPTGNITACCFCSPNVVVVGTALGILTVYNCGTLRPTMHLGLEGRSTVPEGITLAPPLHPAGGAEEDFSDSSSGSEEEDPCTSDDFLNRHPYRGVEGLVHLKSKELLASVMGTHLIYFWSVTHGSLVGTKRTERSEGDEGAFTISDDGGNFLAVGTDDGVVHVYDLSRVPVGAKRIHSHHVMHLAAFRAHTTAVLSLVWAPEFHVLVCVLSPYDVKLFTTNGAHVGSFGDGQWRLEDEDTFKSHPMAVGEYSPRLRPKRTKASHLSDVLSQLTSKRRGPSLTPDPQSSIPFRSSAASRPATATPDIRRGSESFPAVSRHRSLAPDGFPQLPRTPVRRSQFTSFHQPAAPHHRITRSLPDPPPPQVYRDANQRRELERSATFRPTTLRLREQQEKVLRKQREQTFYGATKPPPPYVYSYTTGQVLAAQTRILPPPAEKAVNQLILEMDTLRPKRATYKDGLRTPILRLKDRPLAVTERPQNTARSSSSDNSPRDVVDAEVESEGDEDSESATSHKEENDGVQLDDILANSAASTSDLLSPLSPIRSHHPPPRLDSSTIFPDSPTSISMSTLRQSSELGGSVSISVDEKQLFGNMVKRIMQAGEESPLYRVATLSSMQRSARRGTPLMDTTLTHRILKGKYKQHRRVMMQNDDIAHHWKQQVTPPVGVESTN